MSLEAMKQALEFIKATNKSSSFWMIPASELNKTVNALTVAIEQAERQEPVAWMADNGTLINACTDPHLFTPLYTAPPQRQPLTEEEILALFDAHDDKLMFHFREFARAIERKHGITGEQK